VKNNNLYSFRN